MSTIENCVPTARVHSESNVIVVAVFEAMRAVLGRVADEDADGGAGEAAVRGREARRRRRSIVFVSTIEATVPCRTPVAIGGV